MRDPMRINRICEKLKIIWFAKQDQRLGQLIENLSGRRRTFHRAASEPPSGYPAHYDWTVNYPNLWNIEDDEWERRLDREIDKIYNGFRAANGNMYYFNGHRMVTRNELYED